MLESTDLQITIGAGSAVEGGLVTYGGALQEDNIWQESVSLSAVDVAYNPVETPRLLRRWQDLPTPEWIPSEVTYAAIAEASLGPKRKLWDTEEVGGPFVPPKSLYYSAAGAAAAHFFKRLLTVVVGFAPLSIQYWTLSCFTSRPAGSFMGL